MVKKQDSHILYCHCAYANILPQQAKQEVLQGLIDSGLPFTEVPDLCKLSAHKAPLLAELSEVAHLTIAACHPRAIQWLFAAGGGSLHDGRTQFLNMREASVEQLRQSIRELASNGKTAGHSEGVPASSLHTHDSESGLPDWKPWFPVIDHSRCQNCRQCMGFCLFGVYALNEDGKVYVKNPTSCKTDCPACARVCPETAIIFPKYPNPPINGGELKEGDAPFEPVKVDLTTMTRGDVLQALRERNMNSSRFSPDPGRLKAVQERFAHLSGAKVSFDIPLDVLASRPGAKKESE